MRCWAGSVKAYFVLFIVLSEIGCGDRTRTDDLRVMSALLYRLSYSAIASRCVSHEPSGIVVQSVENRCGVDETGRAVEFPIEIGRRLPKRSRGGR